MKATRHKYKMNIGKYGRTRLWSTWAANKERVSEQIAVMRSSEQWDEPIIIDTKTITLPKLNFISRVQKAAFFEELSNHAITVEDVLLYEYCTLTTQRRCKVFHRSLIEKTVLLGIEFQADIFGMTIDQVRNRAQIENVNVAKNKLRI